MVAHPRQLLLYGAAHAAQMEATRVAQLPHRLIDQFDLHCQGCSLFAVHVLFVDQVDQDGKPRHHSFYHFLFDLLLRQLLGYHELSHLIRCHSHCLSLELLTSPTAFLQTFLLLELRVFEFLASLLNLLTLFGCSRLTVGFSLLSLVEDFVRDAKLLLQGQLAVQRGIWLHVQQPAKSKNYNSTKGSHNFITCCLFLKDAELQAQPLSSIRKIVPLCQQAASLENSRRS